MGKLLKVPEVAERLNATHQAVYELTWRKLLPVVRIGRSVRIDPDALEAFIAAGGTPRDPNDEVQG